METLYAVEYRNMRTAVHGLFVYDKDETAFAVDTELAEIEEKAGDISAEDPAVEAALRVDEMATDTVEFEEIDYRDVEWDEGEREYLYRPPLDDDTVIVVVNEEHAVHDIWAL